MATERVSEELTKELMNFKIGENGFGHVYAQGDNTSITTIDDALRLCGGKPKNCSLTDFETRGKGKGKPEFIITFKNYPDTIIVIECKTSIKGHGSEDYSKPSTKAIDGVLYYAKYLKEHFNVIAIAQSGTKKESFRASSFYWQKKRPTFEHLVAIEDFLFEPENYLRHLEGEELKKTYSLEEIKLLAVSMNEKMRSAKITQDVKPLFVAGILLALEDQEFSRNYTSFNSYSILSTQLSISIERVLKKSGIDEERRKYIFQQFKSSINGKAFKDIDLIKDGSLLWYIKQLAFKIKPMMDHVTTSLDALSIFYHEFIQYSTGKDGKLLGQVLTPQHLTEFMVKLSNTSKNDKVLDICCGSSAFLVSAMHEMFKQCKTPAERERVRKEALYGIEIDEKMHTLSLTNMIVRQDGKSNIIYGDCFNKKYDQLKKKNINIGLLNPPYSIKEDPELKFVKRLLDLLAVKGIGVVVVPMSCAIGTKYKEERHALMKHHTLKAVFSMPDDIFYPTGTNTCVMVWEAHVPHDNTKETFFGYYKNDGFVKRKQLGRVDALNKWSEIENEWLELYRNNQVVVGKTAKQCVDVKDEWLVEAYMETDYSTLNHADFQQTINDYLSYLIRNGDVYES